MSWMGSTANLFSNVGSNLGMSFASYGLLGTMTYDSSKTDVYNQTAKMGTGLAVDQVQDLTIFAGGTLAKGARQGLKALTGGFSLNDWGTNIIKQSSNKAAALAAEGRFGAAVASAAKGSTGVFAKGLSFLGRHPIGVGMATVVTASIFAEDLGMMAMDFYDQQEADYRRKLAHPGFHLTQSSSRFIQDQLQTLSRASNEAEIMHN